jgi:hypothetical protein
MGGGGFAFITVVAVFGGVWLLTTITSGLGLKDNFRSWFGIITVLILLLIFIVGAWEFNN